MQLLRSVLRVAAIGCLINLPSVVSATEAERCPYEQVTISPGPYKEVSFTDASWETYEEKAVDFAIKGQFAKAELTWQRMHDLFGKKRGPSDYLTLFAATRVLQYRALRGDDDKSEEILSRHLLAVDTLGPVKGLTAAAYLNFYHFLRSRGKITEARKVLSKIATTNQAVGETAKIRAETYAELAASYAAYDHDSVKALRCFKAANSLFNEAFAGDAKKYPAFVFSRIYTQMMFFGLDLGDKEYAEYAGRQAVRIVERADAGIFVAVAKHNLSKVLLNNGKLGEAERFARETLTASQSRKFDRIAVVQASATLAEILARSDNTASEALELAKLSLATAVELRAGSGDSSVGQTEPGHLRSYMSQYYGESEFVQPAVAAYLSASWKTAALGNGARQLSLAESAFEAVQQALLSEAAYAIMDANLRRSLNDSDGSDMVRQIQDLARVIKVGRQRALEAFASGEKAEAEAAVASIWQTEQMLAGLQTKLKQANPKLFEYAYPRALSVEEVRSRLGSDEGILLISRVGDHVHTFVVTPRTIAWNRLEDANELDHLVGRILCSIDDLNCGIKHKQLEAERTFRGDSLTISDAVLKPALPALTGVTRLYVALSGSLASLPIGILPLSSMTKESSDPGYAADRFAMTLLPTVSSLEDQGNKRPSAAFLSGHRYVGYGAPTLVGSATGRGGSVRDLGLVMSERGAYVTNPLALRELPELPGTEKELKAVASLLSASPAALRLGPNMTERGFKRDAEVAQANVLLIATHGLMPGDLEGIREPGLVFSPPLTSGPDDDGYLSASEVSELAFTSDVVILSACNTATYSGGDLSALARSFLYAGAKSVIGSHWRVSDDATAALTREFLHAAIENPKLSRSQAFQAGMRAVRTGRRLDGSEVQDWDTAWGEPSYWGPFIIIAASD
jgi:CHAT domain-containing protein